MSKLKSAFNFVVLWGARAVLALLAVAGLLHLLAGVDAMIAIPVTIVLVGLLVRETL